MRIIKGWAETNMHGRWVGLGWAQSTNNYIICFFFFCFLLLRKRNLPELAAPRSSIQSRRRVMAFFDLSLLPPPSSPLTPPLLPAARALHLGYSAVALDHPHRGLLADSDRCRLAPFPSPFPAPSDPFRHYTSHPFRQYTRITLSLDSAAAAASALSPSASRLLRTYDIVAARPLTQAALDHLCQASTEVDLISIDFSHKLPFRLKLPMLKLALQRGLCFEIAYSPLIDDVNSRRQVLAEAKLLVDWTKGKNLIISSAAHTANQIRGPYDVVNLCAYLLGLSTQRAKDAISLNCRSLVSKALRKKHFYKETIRIDRLLPNEQLNSTKYKLGDWIGWDPISFEGDLQSLETNLDHSSNKYELLGSPINSRTKVLHEKHHDADVSLIAERVEQSTEDKEEIPTKTREETLQGEAHSAAIDTILDKPENSEIVMAHSMQAGAASSVDQKCIDEHAEFVHDAMELDTTESCTLNLIAGDSALLSSDDVKLACSFLPRSMGLSDTSLEDKGPDQSTDILDYANAYPKYDTGYTSGEREGQTPIDYEIPSGPDICLKNKGLDKPADIPVESKTHRDITESLGCSPGGGDDGSPLNLAVQSATDLCKDIIPLTQHDIEDKAEQNMDGKIEQAMSYKAEPIDRKTRRMFSSAYTPNGQAISSTAFLYDKGSSDTTWGSYEFKEQHSKENSVSVDEDVSKIHGQLLNDSYASARVDISTARSGKQRKKLCSRRPAYLPFLGLLKPVPFKKKLCKLPGQDWIAFSLKMKLYRMKQGIEFSVVTPKVMWKRF